MREKLTKTMLQGDPENILLGQVKKNIMIRF